MRINTTWHHTTFYLINVLGHAEPLVGILGGPHNGPHVIDKKIGAQIFIVKDRKHKPTQDIDSSTNDVLNRFETEFDVDMTLFWHWNFWNAYDISPADSCSKALEDLSDDCSWAALHGTYIWCDSCRETVNENIWGD